MKSMLNIVSGHIAPGTLRVYLATETLIFWGVIFLCWRLFPQENAFSIHTHTFSYLGSFEADRNPPGWWLFSIAMVFWGLASVPVVLHNLRCLPPASSRGLLVTRGLMLTGCLGIVLVGLFPDARGPVIGSLRWTDIHYIGAAVLVLGFLTGIPRFALAVRRAARDTSLDASTRRACQRARWPQVIFLSVSGVALTLLILWIFVYEQRRAVAEAAGQIFGSPWHEAMNTPYSFPLWDNVFVQTLFIYLAWTALALSGRSGERQD
jgi:hypothetical membrane protein